MGVRLLERAPKAVSAELLGEDISLAELARALGDASDRLTESSDADGPGSRRSASARPPSSPSSRRPTSCATTR